MTQAPVLPPALGSATAGSSSHPVPPGYRRIDNLAHWESLDHKLVAVAGTYVQDMGTLGGYYAFVLSGEPIEDRRSPPSLLVTFEGLPDPGWRRGATLVVYGQALGHADVLGIRMPLLRADGVSLR